MFKNLKIGSKILVAFTFITIVTAGVSGYISFTIARASLEEESFNKLTAVREMKANQIEDYFQQIANQVVTLSEDRMIVDAMRAFETGFEAIDAELGLTAAELDESDARLARYYEEEFLVRLNQTRPAALGPASTVQYWPEDKNTRILQDLYLASNLNETGSKHLLDAAGDGSSYSLLHQIYHPIIRNFLDKFGYYDIFLVDDESGHIVYSVFKEVDYGTSLLSGPYAGSNFAEAFRAAKEATDKDFVKLVDFESYDPSYNAPASFIASPIYDGQQKIGVLLFQMPTDQINDIMTNKRGWSQVGLGASGETYLVADDFRIRNQSRFLIEDSENYFKLIQDIGVPEETINRIRNLNSTIGLQEVKTQGTQAALRGTTGTEIFPDYRGVPVLSSYKPLSIPDVKWVIMSEIDEAEALASIRSLRNGIFIGSIGLIAVIVIIAFFFAKTLTRPLQELTASAEELAQGNLDVHIDTRGHDEIGVLAQSFEVMQKSVQRLVRRQAEAIDALSTPLIPLHDDVMVMPLVGQLDERRVSNIREALVEGLHASSAKVAILDLTGVPPFDQVVAHSLVNTARTAKLLGAQVVITGIQPEIATALVELDLQFDGLVTERSLQNGIAYAMKHI